MVKRELLCAAKVGSEQSNLMTMVIWSAVLYSCQKNTVAQKENNYAIVIPPNFRFTVIALEEESVLLRVKEAFDPSLQKT